MLKSTVLTVLFILSIVACVSNTGEDCATISGATFSSSGGRIQTIINTKCSGSACHSAGGTGSIHWVIGNYNSMKPFFEHMHEAVESGEMPEAGSVPMTADELSRFECWASSGYPE